MPAPSLLVVGASATGTLNINAAVAGTITAGPTVVTNAFEQGTLCADVTVDAETSTITMGVVWQVSNDASTWKTLVLPNNPATVVLATGTGGADAPVSRVIAAPESVSGWRYCRASIQNLVADGTTNDTYSIAYNYARPGF
jgi:hypothetical protein